MTTPHISEFVSSIDGPMLEISRKDAMAFNKGNGLCDKCPFFKTLHAGDCSELGPGAYCTTEGVRDIIFAPLGEYIAWKIGATK